MQVCLNRYDHLPGFLKHAKIETVQSTHFGDLKDVGKFFWNGNDAGYHLSCDDDLVYPSNYVARIFAAVEQYEKSAVVGYHGILLHARVASYYRDRTVYHFSRSLDTDRSVHIVGKCQHSL